MPGPLLEIRDCCRNFVVDRSLTVEAVRHFSLTLRPGEIYGLVGESGCGKSTLARTIIGVYPVSSGEIWFQGLKISDRSVLRRHRREVRRGMQMIFQDSSAALNPVMSVEEILAEPLEVWGLLPRGKERREVLERLLHRVGMDASALCRQPAELSGGQRQRVAIARAVAVHPELVIADEPVASLDVSMQAQIVTLFQQIQQEQGFSFLYISHDLAMVRYLCDRVGVMRAGRLVEEAETDELFAHPCHAYTRVLLSAMPEPDPRYERARTILSYDEEELGTTFEEVSPGHRVLR